MFMDNLLSLLLNNNLEDGPYPDGDGPGPDGDGPGPDGDGPGPDGDGPDPDENGPDKNDKGSGKGKGKAKAITPDSEDSEPEKPYTDKGKGKAKAITPDFEDSEPEKPYTDNDLLEENFQADTEQATLNSLNEELSKKGKGESSKQGAELGHLDFLKEQEIKSKSDEYRATEEAYWEKVREYNDILQEIEETGDNMNNTHKEQLLNESIKIRKAVDHYSNHRESLKNELNIGSSKEESNSEENNSWENSSEDSSDQDSRPSKRPRT